MKAHVLECFATGFVSHFEYQPPEEWGHVDNYEPLRDRVGQEALRKAMRKQVLLGRMIGGPGWTSETISQFFGGQGFYGIPCGATEKDGNPRGRIVHDYGHYKAGSYSVNAAHSSTSVTYLKFTEVVQILHKIKWFVKADLASGFRQFGTHPVDWRFQVYCNGTNEHYIDIACPFGKTNSPLEFCPPVALLAKSVARHYAKSRLSPPPRLGTHVDDIFGGFPNCGSFEKACDFREYLCKTGKSLTVEFNMKPSKTPMPAKMQVILGCL